ncbi:MAG: hypothetical protein JXB05_10560 [Myxococcaceae bacterium]|nr:hypothetical protein [Myxococcaceae bacterium]
MSGSPALTFSPTLNVDVGGTTSWMVTGVDSDYRWSWSSPGENTIVALSPQGNGATCKIEGLAGGETTITVRDESGRYGEATHAISVGLMFVYAPDGTLYAATTSSFVRVEHTNASVLTIPTLREMAEKEAYYVPPPTPSTDSVTNVTCYVINLGYIRSNPADLWNPSSSEQATEKKSGK